jgi:hypothetical protein
MDSKPAFSGQSGCSVLNFLHPPPRTTHDVEQCAVRSAWFCEGARPATGPFSGGGDRSASAEDDPTQCASVASVFCGQVAGSTRNPPEGGVRHNNQLIHFRLQTSELIRGGNSQWHPQKKVRTPANANAPPTEAPLCWALSALD